MQKSWYKYRAQLLSNDTCYDPNFSFYLTESTESYRIICCFLNVWIKMGLNTAESEELDKTVVTNSTKNKSKGVL